MRPGGSGPLWEATPQPRGCSWGLHSMNPISFGGRNGALVTVLLASTALVGIHPAFAQDAPAAGATIETVVVTAEKHAESLQKVPFAIQAIGNEKIDQLNITDFNDYVKYLPERELHGGSTGRRRQWRSGLRDGDDARRNQWRRRQPFRLAPDRRHLSRRTADHDHRRRARHAHLRHRSVSRHSRGRRVRSTARARKRARCASSPTSPIRADFRRPTRSSGTSIDGGGLGGTVEGYVNVPITDNAAIRLVAWDEHDGGYIDNVKGTRTYPTSGVTINNFATARNNYNFTDTIGGRAALGIDLDDNWTITPSIVAQSENTNGSFGYDPSVGLLKVTHFYPEYAHDQWYQAALTVQGKIGDLDLTYSGGHMDRWINAASDYTDYSYWYDVKYGYGAYWTDNSGNPVDPSQYIIEKDHFTKDSHEFRIATPSDQPLRFVGGLYYERQGHKIVQNYKINALGSDFWVSPAWPQTIWLTDQERVDRDFAVFGELSYDITPQLTVTGGARVFNADNSLYGFFGFGDGYSSHTGVSQCFSAAQFNNAPCTNLNKSVQEWGYTHKLSLKYQIDDDRMVYATWSTGFRPGGINRRGTIPPYSPDKLTNYELGWKTAWYNGQLTFNGDVFWEDWNKFQFSFLGLNSFTGDPQRSQRDDPGYGRTARLAVLAALQPERLLRLYRRAYGRAILRPNGRYRLPGTARPVHPRRADRHAPSGNAKIQDQSHRALSVQSRRLPRAPAGDLGLSELEHA